MSADLQQPGVDPYAYWRASLAGENPPARQVETPYGPEWRAEVGFYRLPLAGGFEAVAVWLNGDGDLVARVSKGRIIEAAGEWVERVFSRCKAVTEEDYRRALETGSWPDYAPAGIGHNKRPEGFEAIRDAVQDLLPDADRLVKAGAAKTQEEADAASNLAQRLKGHGAAADTMRKAEKKPHTEAAAAVDEKFNPIVSSAKVRAEQLAKLVVAPFLIAQRQRVKEAAKKVEAETGVNPLPKSRGGYDLTVSASAGAKGAKTFLVTTWSAEIDDFDAALAALKDHPDLRACVATLCDAAARAKVKTPIPGVRFVATEQARG